MLMQRGTQLASLAAGVRPAHLAPLRPPCLGANLVSCSYSTASYSPYSTKRPGNHNDRSRSSRSSQCAYPAVAVTVGLLAHNTFSTSSMLHLESSSDNGARSASSSIFRQASPAAMRTPACQLVFVSLAEHQRDEWGSWIGYFREAGYDCIDLNLALEGVQAAAAADVQEFAEELREQIRIMSLQRRPLLFVQTSHAAHTALAQLQSRDPQMSGLVVALGAKDMTDEATSGTPDHAEKNSSIGAQIRNLDTKRLRILVIDNSKKDALRHVERWMTDEGLA